MKIAIAQRLHPFSHRMGTACPIPLSTWQATVYPCRIIFQKIVDPSQTYILDLCLQGPIKDFTVELDLEKALIRVFGKTAAGYFRYEISRSSDGIQLWFEKLSHTPLQCTLQGKSISYQIEEKQKILISLPPEERSMHPVIERLSLGSHKSQDWDLVLRRFDLKEILPSLMRLGDLIPPQPVSDSQEGSLSLLKNFAQQVILRNKLETISTCEKWLLASFTGIFTPTLQDPFFQGIFPSGPIKNHPVVVQHLTEGSALIRSLFFEQTVTSWDILPCLLPIFDAGRFTDLKTESGEQLSFEWSKHQLKKLIITTKEARQQTIGFPKELRSFRLRQSRKEKGKVYHLKDHQVVLDLPPNSVLWLDCFKK